MFLYLCRYATEIRSCSSAEVLDYVLLILNTVVYVRVYHKALLACWSDSNAGILEPERTTHDHTVKHVSNTSYHMSI